MDALNKAKNKEYYFQDPFSEIDLPNLSYEELKSEVLGQLNENSEYISYHIDNNGDVSDSLDDTGLNLYEAVEQDVYDPDNRTLAIFAIEWDMIGGDFENISYGTMDHYTPFSYDDSYKDVDSHSQVGGISTKKRLASRKKTIRSQRELDDQDQQLIELATSLGWKSNSYKGKWSGLYNLKPMNLLFLKETTAGITMMMVLKKGL